MIENNNVELLFEARSENEAFARVVAAAFVTYLDPTIEELQDIKTAVSEAVTNAIVHGYDNGPGKVRMRLKGIQNQVIIEVHDDGLGIENVAKAMEPLYTTKPEQERSGMGFVHGGIHGRFKGGVSTRQRNNSAYEKENRGVIDRM